MPARPALLFSRQDPGVTFFLGVDGGQTSTVALIADQTGRVLGAGTGGACNHVASSEARSKFANAMAESIGGACRAANLPPDTLKYEAACLGFSGGFADKEIYCREFIKSKVFKLTHDAEIALTGATAGGPGIIVIAGTGSMAFGRNASNQSCRAGGWGYIFGDEGGAFYLVRQALRAALSMEEGWGSPTSLRHNLLKATGFSSANDLMHAWYKDVRRDAWAQYAPLVDQAAANSDVSAIAILEEAGRFLTDLVSHVYGQLFKDHEAAHISYVGGVFESSCVRHTLKREVLERTGCNPTPPLLPPAAGALLEALRLSGIVAPLTNLPTIKQ